MWVFSNPMKTFLQEENLLLFIHSDYRKSKGEKTFSGDLISGKEGETGAICIGSLTKGERLYIQKLSPKILIICFKMLYYSENNTLWDSDI